MHTDLSQKRTEGPIVKYPQHGHTSRHIFLLMFSTFYSLCDDSTVFSLDLALLPSCLLILWRPKMNHGSRHVTLVDRESLP